MVKDYSKNIQRTVDHHDLIKSETPNLTGTYLFFSLDIVNSTFFKNKINTWAEVFSTFFKFCKHEVQNELFPHAEVWKMVGDEILFYMPVSNESDIYQAPHKVYDLMDRSIEVIRRHEEAKGILSVKATMWIAYAEDVDDTDNQIEYGNIILKERVVDNITLDFLGPDIDIGFRVSKFASQKKLAVDAKLACLLTKLETGLSENSISESMRIVSYEQLKGVWDNRHYPIVWYQPKWDSVNSMFWYDQKFNSNIIKRIVDTKLGSLEPVSNLTKIFKDLNKLKQIEKLRDGVKELEKKNIALLKEKSIPIDRLSELHLVAICVNEKDEILISKRTKKEVLSLTWEFGCAQLHLRQTFKEAMIEGYKEDFNVALEFIEKDPSPIGQYIIKKEKEKNRVVPGLIFVAKINSTQVDDQKFDTTKHSDIRWVTADSAKDIPSADCVPKFHQRIIDTYKYLEKHKTDPK
nr:hypothetical protein [uncultured Desulfobacter sp.]